ncbi:MAG: molybdopterin molybdotransferase MoeA [Bacteroidales bacterium]|jgi:molybdopterin molybdotransferase|nr:molybdopterin molybdotransferase MoeA [Bacteroidales bacterium]
MISFDEAYKIVMDSLFMTGTEAVWYEDSFGRILAEDVLSDMDMPPFDKSTVDGFACRSSDLGHPLELIETIPAGCLPQKIIGENQCAAIMTGAMMPEGADCVIMVEDTEELSTGIISFTSTYVKTNIAYKGEDICEGDVVLKAFREVKPQDIAVMAATGHTSALVGRKPRVAIISSGNEIVEPNIKPGLSQIRNSNSGQLAAQVKRAGASATCYGIAPDDEEETYILVRKSIEENDIVLITGGVSMGKFDFVPSVLERAGVKLLFTRVAIQPGKPTTFGIHEKARIFGLPGNPVSSFVVFELLVRPYISGMMGFEWKPPVRYLPLADRFIRRTADRMMWMPVKVTDDNRVLPVEYHGSAHISAFPDADGIISIPVGIKTLQEGQMVEVRII